MIIEALYTLLSQVNAKTYPGVTEQEVEPPFIVHSIVKTIPYPSKDGESSYDVLICKIGSYDTKQSAAHTQADAIRVLLDEYSGTVNQVEIKSIRFVDEEDGPDELTKLFFVIQTYRIWINYNT